MHDAPAPGDAVEEIAALRGRIRERLHDVDRVIAVTSGKGGVGKSAVAVNLALALARRGLRTGLLDADLQGPSVAKMLGLRGQPLRVGPGGLHPAPAACDLRVQSLDFFLQGAQAPEWDGEAEDGVAIRSVLEDAVLADLIAGTTWGALDVLVVDLPPGADRLPAFARICERLEGALAVTIPTEVSLLAVERALRRALEAQLPMIGLVENMGRFACPRCGDERALFREADVERVARDCDVPVLARVPFDPRLAEAGDAGRPYVELAGASAPAALAFDALASAVLARASARLEEER